RPPARPRCDRRDHPRRAAEREKPGGPAEGHPADGRRSRGAGRGPSRQPSRRSRGRAHPRRRDLHPHSTPRRDHTEGHPMSREQVTGARYEPDDYDEVEDYTEPDGYDDEHPDDEVEVQERRPAPRNRSRQAPRNMSRLPRPQDHKRKRPQVQREAEGDDTIDIEFRGATYTVAADQDDWNLDAMEA